MHLPFEKEVVWGRENSLRGRAGSQMQQRATVVTVDEGHLVVA
jgi:hypothetical protein